MCFPCMCASVLEGQKRPSGDLWQATYSLEAVSLPEGSSPTFSSRQDASNPPTSACLLQVSCFCGCWDLNCHPEGYSTNTPNG